MAGGKAQRYATGSGEAVRQLIRDGAVFRKVEFCDVSLATTAAYDMVFRDCLFEDVNLLGANWQGVTFATSRFRNCRFVGANFQESVFDSCDFFDPDRSLGCNFVRADMRSLTCTRCDLSACDFEEVDAFQMTIKESKGIGARFFKTRFRNLATITGNVLRYADLRGAELGKCDLSHNDLQWATLDEANFGEANFIGTNLNGATMRHATFAGADLRGAGLSSFDLRAVDLRGAKILNYQMRGLIENYGLVVFPDPT